VETRWGRARQDAKKWVKPSPEIIGAFLTFVVTFVALRVWGSNGGVTDFLIAAAGALGTAILLPLVVFLGSAATAPVRLLREEIARLGEAVAGLGQSSSAPRSKRKPATSGHLHPEARALVELYSKGRTLYERTPLLDTASVPTAFESEIKAWRNDVLAEMLKDNVDQFYVRLFEAEPPNDRMSNPTRALVDYSLGILNDAIKARYGAG
jgi:hypothetical protein